MLAGSCAGLTLTEFDTNYLDPTASLDKEQGLYPDTILS